MLDRLLRRLCRKFATKAELPTVVRGMYGKFREGVVEGDFRGIEMQPNKGGYWLDVDGGSYWMDMTQSHMIQCRIPGGGGWLSIDMRASHGPA